MDPMTNEVVQGARVAVAPAGLLDKLAQAVEAFDVNAAKATMRAEQAVFDTAAARIVAIQRAMARELRAEGLEDLAQCPAKVRDEGKWEGTVELVEIVWTLPGYRAVGMMLGHWPRKMNMFKPTEPDYWKWELAAHETGGEVASWYGTDAEGNQSYCDSLPEALSVSKVRGGTLVMFTQEKIPHVAGGEG